MRLFDWLGRSGLAVISFQDQCRTMLSKSEVPCFSLRWKQNDEEDFFLVQGVYPDGSYAGYASKELNEPSVGQRVLRDEYVNCMRLMDVNTIVPNNGTDVDHLRRRISRLHQHLPYNRRATVFLMADGTPVWVKGGFNNNEAGFAAERAYSDPMRPDGVQAVFFPWSAVPYYRGTFLSEFISEPIKNFVYYSWMGDNITTDVKEQRDVARRSDLTCRLEQNIAQRKVLDADLADIIRQMKTTNVHE